MKSNFLDHRHVLVPLAAAITAKHCENVVVISSNNGLLYLMGTGSQRYVWSRHLFYIALEAGIYCENKGSIEKTRDLCRGVASLHFMGGHGQYPLTPHKHSY